MRTCRYPRRLDVHVDIKSLNKQSRQALTTREYDHKTARCRLWLAVEAPFIWKNRLQLGKRKVGDQNGGGEGANLISDLTKIGISICMIDLSERYTQIYAVVSCPNCLGKLIRGIAPNYTNARKRGLRTVPSPAYNDVLFQHSVVSADEMQCKHFMFVPLVQELFHVPTHKWSQVLFFCSEDFGLHVFLW